jgi:two-component system sensor histidine kinase KdpD
MLEAASELEAKGMDVVAGIVETHGRAETEAMLHDLEVLPLRWVEYRGTRLKEFDLDAALARRPTLILIDELAHTNAPGSRHAKRWQDVEELLDAGIHVYATVNVQHLESLNDVVAQITNVVVRETIPDSIVEQADEVELIDLPPDDLLQRLREGKVYVPQQAERAMRSFFRKGNLIALRELALRRTAERVDEQMQTYMRDHAIPRTWPAAERIMVCIGPNPLSARLVRAARRMAAGLRAEWITAYVETPSHARLPEVDKERVIQTLRLAEQLGAETVTLSGHSVSDEILTYARERNVSKIVVGKPDKPRWREMLSGSIVDTVVRHSGEIDVYVISGDTGEMHPSQPVRSLRRTSPWRAYGWGATVVVVCTLIARLMWLTFDLSNLIMVYLLGVVLVATRFGRGPSILASILSVAAFDFFFVTPYLTFAVSDTQYLVTFGVMLLTALVISNLTVRTRQQAEAARQREKRTAALYAMGRELVSTRGIDNIAHTVARHVGEVFESAVVVLLPDATDGLTVQAAQPEWPFELKEQSVAQWAYDHSQMAGLYTSTLPGAEGLYLPLIASRGTVGILGVRPTNTVRFIEPEQLHMLETFASQTALAVERARLAEEAEQARVQVETERLRSSLLSSVSHDFRTPLAAITGAASSLLEDDGEPLAPATHRELAQSIYDEAERLNRLVRNLLDMTKLQAGAVTVNKEWQPLEEVVGAALTRLEKLLGDHPLSTQLPVDLPLVPIDGVLIEQALVNLLENAVKYTPPDAPIEISAWRDASTVVVEVADHGPGLPPGEEQRIFDKFYRAPMSRSTTGVGLGLTICRAIIEAHGGRIWAENRPGGGAAFRFTLPIEGQPPEVKAEE